jgi:hypothetical protein
MPREGELVDASDLGDLAGFSDLDSVVLMLARPSPVALATPR